MPGWVWGATAAAVVALAMGAVLLLGRRSAPQPPPAPVESSPQPRPTTAPSSTPESGDQIPDPVTQVLAGVEVFDVDDFAALSAAKWLYADTNVETVAEGDGMVRLTGASPFATYLIPSRQLEEGQAVLLLFRYEGALPVFEAQLNLGDWQTPSYRRFGLARWDEGELRANIWEGEQNMDSQEEIGAFSLAEQHWYYLLLAVGKDADFLLRIWDAQNTDNFAEYRRAFGESWDDQLWDFVFKVDRGVMYLDDYAVLSFNAYK